MATKNRERFFAEVDETTDLVFAVSHAAEQRLADMIEFFGSPGAFRIISVDATLNGHTAHVALLAERAEA